MLLDHTREFVHNDAFLFNPTDLSKTNTALFFTRWITHLCAPTFVFLSGMSIYLLLLRGKSRFDLSKFLLTRTVADPCGVHRHSLRHLFNFDYRFVGLAELIWIFGASMICLAGLIYLPVRVVGIFGVAMIALHNLLDGIKVPPAVSMTDTPAPDFGQSLWLLHQPGFVPPFGGTANIFVAYPLVPWVGVMAAGFCSNSAARCSRYSSCCARRISMAIRSRGKCRRRLGSRFCLSSTSRNIRSPCCFYC